MRLFIAFPLDAAVKAELARITAQLAGKGGPVKWVEPENMHLTVRFLGETPENKVPSLRQLLDAVASRFEVIDASFYELGGFPNIHRPRVIWLGMQGPIARIRVAAAEVEKRVVALGFDPEPKGFKPHLTLGRVRDDQRIGNLLDHLRTFSFEAIPARIDRLILYQSTLTPKGPVYQVLHEARLQS